MKKLIVLFALVIGLTFNVRAQASFDTSIKSNYVTPLLPPVPAAGNEQEASFIGGNTAWAQYLQQNLDASVPVKNHAPAGKYQVVIKFVVRTDGSISNIEPQTNFGWGMEQEAIRVIKNSPKWNPGYQFGRYVNSYRLQPISFSVIQQ